MLQKSVAKKRKTKRLGKRDKHRGISMSPSFFSKNKVGLVHVVESSATH